MISLFVVYFCEQDVIGRMLERGVGVWYLDLFLLDSCTLWMQLLGGGILDKWLLGLESICECRQESDWAGRCYIIAAEDEDESF